MTLFNWTWLYLKTWPMARQCAWLAEILLKGVLLSPACNRLDCASMAGWFRIVAPSPIESNLPLLERFRLEQVELRCTDPMTLLVLGPNQTLGSSLRMSWRTLAQLAWARPARKLLHQHRGRLKASWIIVMGQQRLLK